MKLILLWVSIAAKRRRPTSGPWPELPEPPFKGSSFSIILPFFPPQVDQLKASMACLGRHVQRADLDMFFAVSPCKDQAMARAAVECALPRPVEFNSSFESELDKRRGLLHLMPEWQQCRNTVFDWVPDRRVQHMCDDAVLCGKTRGCLDAVEQRRGKQTLGWYVQQMVKLGIARFVTSPHLLVLDADTYAIQSISAKTMLTDDGTAKLVSFKKVRKGTPIISEAVGARWAPRYVIALDLLQANASATVPEDTKILGVTPEVLSTALSRRILTRLEETSGIPWYEKLAASRFTEFTLYNTFLMLEWESVGKGLHVSTARRNRQLAVWGHDLDDAPGLIPGLSTTGALDARMEYAETIIRNRIHTLHHDDHDPHVGHFFICQDESGLTPDKCGALAAISHQLIQQHQIRN